jgi:hypothetical protein
MLGNGQNGYPFSGSKLRRARGRAHRHIYAGPLCSRPTPRVFQDCLAVDPEYPAAGREDILRAFRGSETLPPTAPPPRPAKPWFAGPQPQEELSPEAIDELVQGSRAGDVSCLRRLLGEEPGFRILLAGSPTS